MGVPVTDLCHPRCMEMSCNAVFKGGGAKGVAYVGALEACERAGFRFEAVAGSSAGAITAVLVAAGYKAAELRELMPAALRTVSRPMSTAPRFDQSSLLSSDSLRAWLDEIVAAKVRPGPYRADDPPCTFAELFERTSIGLYVVAMDLADRQPVVFSHDITPSMSIADAVVASSAIPVVFPPSLIEVDGETRRLVDGGAYANYPAFVFDDASFRAHHGLPLCTETLTLGFILEQAEQSEPAVEHRFRALPGPRLDSDRGSAARELGPIGAALTSPVVRWSLIVLPFAFVLVVVLWLIGEAEHGYPVLGSLPARFDPLEDVGLMIVALIVAAIGVIAIAASLVVARLGRDMLDVGLMGAMAAMGVGPNVPYWVGAATGGNVRHIAIRIPVPSSLGTLSFRAPPDVVDEAIDAGREATAIRLAEARSATDRLGITLPLPDVAESTARAPEPSIWRRWLAGSILRRPAVPTPLRQAATTAALVYLGGTAIGTLALTSLTALLTERPLEGAVLIGFTGIAMIAGAAALARRKSWRAADPFPILGRLSTPLLRLIAVAGILGTGLLVNFGLSQGRVSIPTLAATESTEVAVEYIDRSNQNIPLVWVTFVEGLDLEEIKELRNDARGTEIMPCANPLSQPDDGLRERIEAVARARPDLTLSGRCVIFDTDNDSLEVGESEVVRFDVERGFAVLQKDLWSLGFVAGPAIITTLAIAFLASSYHSVRAMRWRRASSRRKQVR